MKKIRIKNVSSYKITIVLGNVRYRRDLEPNQETTLPEDVFEEFNFDPGCRNYVKSGFIKIITDDEEIKEQVVAGPEDVDIDVVHLLKEGTVAELGKVLKDASPALKDKIIDAAIKHSILDGPRAKLIEVHCGVDVMKAANLQRSIGN